MNSYKKNQKIWLKEITFLYWEKDLSLAKIASLYECNPATIYRFMVKHKIKRREFHRRKYNISKEMLCRLYCDERKSTIEIAKMFRCSQWVIWDLMRRYGLKRRDANAYHEWKGPGNLIKPKLDDSPSVSYILGVLLGDGWVYSIKNFYTVALDSKDKEFCEKFAGELQKINLNPCLIRINKKEMWRTTATSRIFYNWFKSLNFDEITRISYKYPVKFIEGFYESEGCLSKSKDKRYGYESYAIIVVNTNKKIMIIIKKLVEMLGFSPTLTKRRSAPPRKPLWVLGLYKQKEISSFLDMINPCMKRKQKPF